MSRRNSVLGLLGLTLLGYLVTARWLEKVPRVHHVDRSVLSPPLVPSEQQRVAALRSVERLAQDEGREAVPQTLSVEDGERPSPAALRAVRLQLVPLDPRTVLADVGLVVRATWPGGAVTRSARTDAEGSARVEVPARARDLSVIGRREEGAGVLCSWTGPLREDVQVLVRPQVRLHGRVRLDLGGEPWPGDRLLVILAHPEVASDVPQHLGLAGLDPQGNFVLDTSLPESASTVLVAVSSGDAWLGSHACAVSDMLVPPGVELSFDVVRQDLQVLGPAGHVPAGATVRMRLASHAGEGSSGVFQATLDADGRASLLMARREYELHAAAAGHRPESRRFLAGANPLELRLAAQEDLASFRVQVRDGRGAAVEAALVTITDGTQHPDLALDSMFQGLTDGRGALEAPLLHDEALRVAVVHARHQARLETLVRPRAGDTLEIVLDDSANLRLVPEIGNGRPFEGEGALWWFVARADSEWSVGGVCRGLPFLAPAVPAGDVVVGGVLPDLGLFGLVRVQVEPGPEPVPVPLRLENGLYLEGVVSGGSSRTLEVIVRPHDLPRFVSERWCRSRVGGEGRFRVFSTTDRDADLEVLDGATGELLWSGPMDASGGRLEVVLP